MESEHSADKKAKFEVLTAQLNSSSSNILVRDHSGGIVKLNDLQKSSLPTSRIIMS